MVTVTSGCVEPTQSPDTLLRTLHTRPRLLLTEAHFTDKAGSEGFSNLSKVTQLTRRRALYESRGCSSPFITPCRPPKAACTQHSLTEPPLWTQRCVRGAGGFYIDFNLLMLVFQPVRQLVNIPGGSISPTV